MKGSLSRLPLYAAGMLAFQVGLGVRLAAQQPSAEQPPAQQTQPLQPPVDEPGVATGLGSRFLQTNTPLTNDKGIFEALVTHRFNQAVNVAGVENLLGLDSGSNTGIGFEYVPVRNVAVQMYRAVSRADYELAAKITALRPTRSLPIAVGLRGGLDWQTAPYVEKRSTAFGQLLVTATLGDLVTIGAAPTWVQRSDFDTDVFNVPLTLQVKITRSIAAMAEYVPQKSFKADQVGQWSFGIQKSVYRHKFALWIGNSIATSTDQIMVGGANSPVTDSNIHLGFHIIRDFDIAAD